MRYFTAPAQLFDALRLQVMDALGQPDGGADQPWPEGTTTLALAPHEYERFPELIAFALANGGTELTEAEYQALQPTSPLITAH